MIAPLLFAVLYATICAIIAYVSGASWALVIASYICTGMFSFGALTIRNAIRNPEHVDEQSIQEEVDFLSGISHDVAAHHDLTPTSKRDV